MRSLLFKFSILLSLGLIATLLNACAFDGASDPPVTPDITIPSTLQVTVMVVEDQDASDGQFGSSDVTVQFSTNEIAETNTVIFTHGEKISCSFNSQPVTLGSAVSYSFHVPISSNPLTYGCDYHYFRNGTPESRNIFMFNGGRKPLWPLLVRPVGNNSTNFMVSYTPDQGIINASNCTIQVTANAPNGSVTGRTTPQTGTIQNRSIYAANANVSGLSGSGNILMTRSCTPCKYNHDNDADDTGLAFDAIKVTYVSKASSEVTWISPSTT